MDQEIYIDQTYCGMSNMSDRCSTYHRVVVDINHVSLKVGNPLCHQVFFLFFYTLIISLKVFVTKDISPFYILWKIRV